MHFLEKIGFLTTCLAPPRKVVLELFVWGLISYLFCKKIFRHFPAKNVGPIFLVLTPHFWQNFISFSLQTGSRQYILVYNSNIQLWYDTTLYNFLFQLGSFWA